MTTLSYKRLTLAENSEEENGASEPTFWDSFEEMNSSNIEALIKKKDNKFVYFYRGKDSEAA